MIGRRDFFFSCPLCFIHTHASLLTSFVFFFVLFHSCCSHAQVFGKMFVHEFPMYYSHTEWYLLFFILWRQWIIWNGALLNKSCYYPQYHRTFTPMSVSLWMILMTPCSMVWDWRVSRARLMPCIILAPHSFFVSYCFPFLCFHSICWFCGAGVFGLIGCNRSLPALHWQAVLIIMIIIKKNIYFPSLSNIKNYNSGSYAIIYWTVIKLHGVDT